MLMFRFSKAHPTRLESTSVACDKVREHVSLCILRMRIKKPYNGSTYLIVNDLTTPLAIGLPSNVSSTRFA
jgi:hypothetical protein